MTSTDLLLAEELLLLALDDEKGKDTTMGTDTGLAGALLLDLAAGGWLEDAGGKLVPAAAPPAGATPPHGVLADALRVVQASSTPRDAGHWLRKLTDELKPIKGRVAARLVDRGVLTEQRHKVLGLFGTDRYPEADPARSAGCASACGPSSPARASCPRARLCSCRCCARSVSCASSSRRTSARPPSAAPRRSRTIRRVSAPPCSPHRRDAGRDRGRGRAHLDGRDAASELLAGRRAAASG